MESRSNDKEIKETEEERARASAATKNWLKKGESSSIISTENKAGRNGTKIGEDIGKRQNYTAQMVKNISRVGDEWTVRAKKEFRKTTNH